MSDALPRPPDPRLDVRSTLFGDLPLSHWGNAASTAEPWRSFRNVKEELRTGSRDGAVTILRNILAMPGLESRHYLQAWNYLRDTGIEPDPGQAKQVYGVVAEVPMPGGLDIIAAYADCHARYFNYSGAAVVWEAPDHSLDASIVALLEAGARVVREIGPWEGPRPPVPSGDHVRINMLTPSGLHFGEGPFEILYNDPLGGPVLRLAARLMGELIALYNTAQNPG